MSTERAPLMESEDNNATPSPSAADARRRSGRVVRAPRKFTEELQNDTSARRKRARDDNDEEDTENQEPRDLLEEASDDEPVEESDEDLGPRPTKSKPRTKKPAAKKPKTNGGSPADAVAKQGTSLSLPNRPKKTVRVAIARKDGDGLYGEKLVRNTFVISDLALTSRKPTSSPRAIRQMTSQRIGSNDTKRATQPRLLTWSTAYC